MFLRCTAMRGRGAVRQRVAMFVTVLAVILVEVVAPAPPVEAQSVPAIAAPAPFVVALTAGGFVPDRVTVVPGQTITIRNESGATRTITSGGDGTFDSGPVAPASQFVLALPSAGTWVASDDATPTANSAVITVGRAELVGDAFTSANSAIPDLDVPDGPVVFHPDLAIEVARNRILVGFTESATVAQANAALAAAGLTILGGNRDAQILVTEVADAGTPGLEYMQSALDVLRAQPGVRTAAYDVRINPETALPRPADPDPLPDANGKPTYTWESVTTLDDSVRGIGSNDGLESARFPQAWNWLDTIRRVRGGGGARSATVVLDTGFDPGHPDLANAKLQTLCTAGGRCTTNPVGFDGRGRSRGYHGTAVAGVVGAVFDRGSVTSPTSQGTVGGDPASDLHLVPFFVNSDSSVTSTVALWSYSAVLDLIIDEKARSGSKFPNLRVINLSAGIGFPLNSVGVPRFENEFAGFRCGPGDSDDLTAPLDSRVACTPNTYDPYLREFRAAAELLRPTGARLATNNVLLVIAAGNDGDKFCAEPRTDSATACSEFVPVSATTGDTFGHLAVNWTGGPPPFVLVEANTATVGQLTRSSFSNVDGQLSADGETVVPTVTSTVPAGYRSIDGTSFSAPLVSAAAGLLSSLTSNWQTVRSLLVDRGTVDVQGSPTPRLDVFASLLGLPAAAGVDALLDVNDLSPDGNQRVVYDDRGQPTSENTASGSTQLRTQRSAPDTNIDMRDFRRFRDAFLDTCGSRPGCPTPEQISLDGSPTHPKRDQNFDGCFRSQNLPRCNYPEDWFSRFDFNGDGNLFPGDFPVLLRPDGTPAPRARAPA